MEFTISSQKWSLLEGTAPPLPTHPQDQTTKDQSLNLPLLELPWVGKNQS